MASCATCPYWTKVVNPNDVSQQNGTCRRYPPNPHAVAAPGGLQFLSVFPSTKAIEVCGEHPKWNPSLDSALKESGATS